MNNENKPTDRDVMQMALTALENSKSDYLAKDIERRKAIHALRTALAAPAVASGVQDRLEIVEAVRKDLIETIRAFGEKACADYLEKWHPAEKFNALLGFAAAPTIQPTADTVQLADQARVDADKRDAELGFVKPDTDRQVFFYEQDFYVLSNFSAFTLNWKGYRFDTSEAAYHFEKFPDHSDIQDLILSAPSAHEAYKVAERNKAHRRADWDDIKVDVMRDIIRTKAEQHEYVRLKLLATGERELIEDSWRDDFWGWGANRDGKNVLGELWMELRAALAAAPKEAQA
jgi:ribA/ribD-fused uncharacterized protein